MLEKEFSKHIILDRLATLEKKAHENFSTHAKETLGKLDSHITALMTHVEKKNACSTRTTTISAPK